MSLAAALLLAACQPGNINRVSLPHLSKGMSPAEVQKVLVTPPKCTVLLAQGKGQRIDVYRLLSASYSLNYLLLFDREDGGLRYWGAPGEFARRDDAGLASPARKALDALREQSCSDARRVLVPG